MAVIERGRSARFLINAAAAACAWAARSSAPDPPRAAGGAVRDGCTDPILLLYRLCSRRCERDVCSLVARAHLAACGPASPSGSNDLTHPSPQSAASAPRACKPGGYTQCSTEGEAVAATALTTLGLTDLLALISITAAVLASAQSIPFILKRPRGPWRDAPDSASWMTIVGAVLLVVASVGIWLGAIGAFVFPSALTPLILLFLLAGLPLFSVGRARRLRVEIEALGRDGKRSESAAAYIMNRLNTMGAHKPRGVLAPRGTDVSSLPEEALATIPQGEIAAAFYRIFRILVATTPWSARVVQVDNDAVTIELSHLRRQTESTVIFRSELGLPPRIPNLGDAELGECCKRDLLTAAAAFILLRLSETHTILQNGLCGVTKWRSLACHVLASSPPWEEDTDTRAELLARAVEKDPGNYAAWSSYFLLRSGDDVIGSTKSEELYATRLRSLLDRVQKVRSALRNPDGRRGYLPLLMRIAYSLTATRLNIVGHLQITNPSCQDRPGCECTRQLALANEAARELCEFIEEAQTGGGAGNQRVRDKLQTFTDEEMVPSYQLLRTYIDYCIALQEASTENARAAAKIKTVEKLQEQQFISLSNIYNRAGVEAHLSDQETALNDLDLALGYRELHDSAFSDPYFTALRQNESFIELTDGHQTLDCLDPLRPHAEKLAQDGINLPDDLLSRQDISDLAKSLDVPVATVRWMQRICELVHSCPRRHHAIPWTNLLVAEGIESRDQLRSELRASNNRAALLERLSKRGLRSHVAPPSQEDLDSWARGRFSRMLAIGNWRHDHRGESHVRGRPN